MTTQIDEATRAKIRDRIAEPERNCDSELVCLIAERSARYVFFPLLFAALIVLLLPVLDGLGIAFSFTAQTLIFVLLAGLFVFTPIGRRLTPVAVKRQNGQRFAAEQFFGHGLHETRSRNAILIFVSWQEHFVTVVADKGIDAKVDQSAWDGLVSDFTAALKAGDVEGGFLRIVDGAGALLTEHFPAPEGKADDLPNHLIEIDGPPYLS